MATTLATTARASTPLPSHHHPSTTSTARLRPTNYATGPLPTTEYTYDGPECWKEKLVSKVQKGNYGTDSEFYNPKKKTDCLTFFEGLRQLNNLALSNVGLQDLISGSDNLTYEEMKDKKGQIHYVYEIDGIGRQSLIKVTCARNKLNAHCVNAPALERSNDQETLKHLHEFFTTVG